jgi:ABC-type branched-subunit amino acid transport system permease subunit
VVFAQYAMFVTPSLFLGPGSLFQVALVGLVGGAARSWGALAGAAAVVWLPSIVSDLVPGLPGIGQLTFALIFAVVALVLPRGLSGTWAAWVERRSAGRAAPGSVGRPPADPYEPVAQEDCATRP